MKNIRYYTFWTLDFLRGSPIRKHYKEIKTIFSGSEIGEELQEKLLSNILQYVVMHTEFYSKFDSSSFYNFPVINKEEVISNMDAIFSKEFKHKKGKLKQMSTSGTTGSPFKTYLSPNKVSRNTADVLFFYKRGNYRVGDRMYHMRIWTKLNKRSKINLLKENFRMFDTSNLDEKGAKNFMKTMTTFKSKKFILGFPSSFSALMDYLEKEEAIDWNIKTIFALAEALPTKTKKRMQALFKCPIMAMYSNQELGILGFQPYTGEDYFELNVGSYFFEFLKLDSDEPAEEMEEARIVITDLFNKAVPLIRYDTGDLGSYSYVIDEKGYKRKVLNAVLGRKADYLYSNTKERLSPYIIITKLWDYYGIKECQLIQDDYDKVTLKVIYRENEDKKKIEKQFTKEIIQVFGEETKLKILEVQEIPRKASGKRKYIVSNVNKEV